MPNRLVEFLLSAITLIFISSCATLGTDVSAINCVSQEYEGIKAKMCVSQSLIDRDLARKKLRTLFETEKNLNVKFIKTNYKLIQDRNDTLTNKWNQVVSNLANSGVFTNLNANLSTSDLNPITKDLLSLKRSDPEIYNFIMQSTSDYFASMPTPVFREINKEIILEDDPSLRMIPYFIEKIFEFYKKTQCLFPIVKTSTKHIYPLRYKDAFICKATAVEGKAKGQILLRADGATVQEGLYRSRANAGQDGREFGAVARMSHGQYRDAHGVCRFSRSGEAVGQTWAPCPERQKGEYSLHAIEGRRQCFLARREEEVGIV